MKKLLFILSFIIASTSAFAEAKCEGGDPFEGVINGHEYCISQKTMTWWAAFAWCQHQGRHLASLQEACGDLYGAIGDAACGNLIKSGVTVKACWSANPSGSISAYKVDAGTGRIGYTNRVPYEGYALCY
ncbi:MAG: hypothetical protein ACI4RJ_00975 [Alphaproteobacteria bacterium]